jgi:hypothetical protein
MVFSVQSPVQVAQLLQRQVMVLPGTTYQHCLRPLHGNTLVVMQLVVSWLYQLKVLLLNLKMV